MTISMQKNSFVFYSLTLLGGWMRFLLACTSDRNRLFLEPVYSLKLGLWSGRLNGFVTSDRKFCFEKLKKKFHLINMYEKKTTQKNYLRNLNFTFITDRNVIQVLYASLNSHWITHLYHCGSLFGFQEFNL